MRKSIKNKYSNFTLKSGQFRINLAGKDIDQAVQGWVFSKKSEWLGMIYRYKVEKSLKKQYYKVFIMVGSTWIHYGDIV